MKSILMVWFSGRPKRNPFPGSRFSRRIVCFLVLLFNLSVPLIYSEERQSAGMSATDMLREPMAPGDAKTQYDLGIFLEITRNYKEAVLCYRKAADKGLAAAQNNLGFCYQGGQGISRNYVEAVKWYRKAASQGFAPAQNNLGVCYRDGTGVTKDLKQAVQWFRSAAEQGLAAA